MAHNLVLENAAVNAGVDAMCALANGGKLQIKTAAGVLLAELTFGNPAFAGAIAGVATANAITPDAAANDTGAAGKYEVRKSDDTLLWTGTAGAAGGGFDLELNNVNIQVGAQVSVTSFTHTAPKSP